MALEYSHFPSPHYTKKLMNDYLMYVYMYHQKIFQMDLWSYPADAVAELVDRESAVEKTVICGLYSAL